MTESNVVLEVRDLEKTFRVGFFRKRVDALVGVSFQVKRGETFGILGPNGAGKTTTLKCALRLVQPTSGSVSIFGLPPSERASMKRLGYMPENPYVYQYLTPVEFLDLCGRLVGMEPKLRKARIDEMLELVDLTRAKDRPIGKFSKGMTQRVGLAQSLLHDPELLILDEPMSGLDPIGRKQIRDILVTQRSRGKTLIFTSHILSDVEMLCDHVIMIDRGRVSADGTLGTLLRPEVRRVEIELEGVSDACGAELRALAGVEVERHGRIDHVRCEGTAIVPEALRVALAANAEVLSVTPRRETLEDLFMRNALGTSEPTTDAANTAATP
jgi:ABC-2 type transport system ATP-binding protein